LTAWGFDNPHPDKQITQVRFTAGMEPSCWCVLGLSLCDAPHFMLPPDVSFGPVKWCTGAVAYGLIEGLAGVHDDGVAYDAVTVSPRWSAAGVKSVATTVKYEASGGYVSYRYAVRGHILRVTVTGNFSRCRLRVLLPAKSKVKSVKADRLPVEFAIERVRRSRYVCLTLEGRGPHVVRVRQEVT
jgi:hypothetical protein